MSARINRCVVRCAESSHIPICSGSCAPYALRLIPLAYLFRVFLTWPQYNARRAPRTKRSAGSWLQPAVSDQGLAVNGTPPSALTRTVSLQPMPHSPGKRRHNGRWKTMRIVSAASIGCPHTVVGHRAYRRATPARHPGPHWRARRSDRLVVSDQPRIPPQFFT